MEASPLTTLFLETYLTYESDLKRTAEQLNIQYSTAQILLQDIRSQGLIPHDRNPEQVSVLRYLVLEISHETASSLSMAASAMNATLSQAAENIFRSHFDARDRAVLTPRQLMGVYSEARSRGHFWTETELRERGLPLYWSEDWLIMQLRKGMTFQILSALYGYKKRTLSQYAQKYGVVQRENSSAETYSQARELFSQGKSRSEIAATLSFSEVTISSILRGSKSEKQRYTEQKIQTSGPYPASIAEVAERIFSGNIKLATSWLYQMVSKGTLVRIGRGLYDIKKTQGNATESEEASGPA